VLPDIFLVIFWLDVGHVRELLELRRYIDSFHIQLKKQQQQKQNKTKQKQKRKKHTHTWNFFSPYAVFILVDYQKIIFHHSHARTTYSCNL